MIDYVAIISENMNREWNIPPVPKGLKSLDRRMATVKIRVNWAQFYKVNWVTQQMNSSFNSLTLSVLAVYFNPNFYIFRNYNYIMN